jgi:hypothetical protein
MPAQCEQPLGDLVSDVGDLALETAPHDAIRKPGLDELDQVFVPFLLSRPVSQPGHDNVLADRLAHGHGRRLNRHRTPTNTMQTSADDPGIPRDRDTAQETDSARTANLAGCQVIAAMCARGEGRWLLTPCVAHNSDILKVRQAVVNQPLEVPPPGGQCRHLAQGSVDGVLPRLRALRFLGCGERLLVDIDENSPFLVPSTPNGELATVDAFAPWFRRCGCRTSRGWRARRPCAARPRS